MKNSKAKIFIYGAGRVGGTLYYSLRGQNDVFVLYRRGNSFRDVSLRFDEFIERINEFDLIILSVPDSQIRNEACRIADRTDKVNSILISHTSGTISYKELKVLEKKGFVISSLHPYFSFYKVRKDVPIENIYFTYSCEGRHKGRVQKILDRVGINAIFLKNEDKIPYHISAVFVSNFSAMLLKVAYEMLRQIKFRDRDATDFIFTLLESTLYNLKRFGIQGTITGPAIRRDTRIINLHKGYLVKYNKLLYKLYVNSTDVIQKFY